VRSRVWTAGARCGYERTSIRENAGVTLSWGIAADQWSATTL